MTERSLARGTSLRTNEERPCPTCRGEGWTVESRSYAPETGQLLVVEVRCARCGGSGKVLVFVYPAPSSRTKSAPCASCGERLPVRELVEVQEDDESLTTLAGDRLCRGCARAHGVEL